MTEVRFGQELVRALLWEQHPDLAELEIRDVEGGWDNQQWRLGKELAVRLPRTERAPGLLAIEQRWLPVLGPRLPLPVPLPVRIGRPSALFAHTWTIARWVEGEPGDREPITGGDAADALAGFLRALHRAAPADAPVNLGRSDPLAGVREGLDRIAAEAREVVEMALAVPGWQRPPVWLHGDLHPANVIVRDGTLAGVIDFGDMCAGDPATDLSAAWIVLPAGASSRFFDAYGPVDEATVARARGWAVLRALGLIAIGRAGRRGLPGGKPTWEPAGYAALDRALQDE
ncbi:aminoglycoside phosphotransferase family protein [Nocardia asteroides]|uniref:aminoglycoside phosphotransferase family protein n=1 Tax=Nocardia asteroides TaxID=1824 RepID=UPI001E55E049|nr:aminoglycoside phosphotransferase family protein [Nocardia asteroides]UGT61722.1 aminoglycoside phosphotransferase family protein [Nocardia asteroides]